MDATDKSRSGSVVSTTNKRSLYKIPRGSARSVGCARSPIGCVLVALLVSDVDVMTSVQLQRLPSRSPNKVSAPIIARGMLHLVSRRPDHGGTVHVPHTYIGKLQSYPPRSKFAKNALSCSAPSTPSSRASRTCRNPCTPPQPLSSAAAQSRSISTSPRRY